MRRPQSDCTPALLSPGDPTAGDEHLPPEHLHGDALRFFERARLTLEGERPWEDPERLALAASLGLPAAPRHRPAGPERAAVAVPDAVLAEFTEDMWPDFRLEAERVTGLPGGHGWEGIVEAPPLEAVVAVMATMIWEEPGVRPLDRWAKENWGKGDAPEVRAAREEISSVRRIALQPPNIWVDGQPLLPLHPRWLPPPEALGSAARGAVVGRCYPQGEGWAWSGQMRLPAAPSAAAVQRRVTLAWQVSLVEIKGARTEFLWEDFLAKRPEIVYRAAWESSLWQVLQNRAGERG